MSVVNPTIDDLLSVTDENRFLLCELAARRACDINDMMRNQHNRAEQLADIEDVSMFMSDDEGRAPNPLSIAFDELAPRKDDEGTPEPGLISYDAATLHRDLGLDDEAVSDASAE
ncbi:MAG: DNA-directed RNA polymerase subunit omega [Coriobacteriia bacterium]|nr:DNA-directed RNA polymerase subunit omega [Coriobacteriia bacterium]MBS5477803.1 DNA-directed RNA polymerase subunit omega [Coriobacteriia bacterium]